MNTTRPVWHPPRLMLSCVFVAVAIISTSTPAQADSEAPHPYTRTVKLSDLDLTTAEGVREMHRRLSLATFRICTAMRPGEHNLEMGRCRAELMRAALAEVSRVNPTHASVEGTKASIAPTGK